MHVSQSITVLHLVHCYSIGGAEAVINYLCRYSPTHINNIVCSFQEPGDDAFRMYGSSTEIACLHKRPGNDARAVWRLSSIIRDNRVDVVHAQGWGTYIEGLLAAKMFSGRSCRFVYAFHGKTITDVQNGIPWRRKAAQRLASFFTDAIIAPSCQMAEEYAMTNGLVPDRVAVIYNGIDLNRYGSHICDARYRLGIPGEDFVIGFVGRLDKVKNLVGLLHAFRIALDLSSLSLRLVVVGDGREMARLKALAEKLDMKNRVTFLGMRDDIPVCLSAMDIYAQPSFYEGHSNTILEAMAAGLPVITTDVGGTPEIITHQKNGLLFQPEDYRGMAESMVWLAENIEERCNLVDAARETVRQRFSVKAMVDSYTELFTKLA